MKYTEYVEPAPDLRRFEPELREEEQYPTLRYHDSPPIPFYLVPRGMIGYQERKRDEMLEAGKDRKTKVKAEDQTEVQRWAFITRLACAFPQIGVKRISEEVVPWDLEEFKRRVAAAETQYRKSMLTSGVDCA